MGRTRRIGVAGGKRARAAWVPWLGSVGGRLAEVVGRACALEVGVAEQLGLTGWGGRGRATRESELFGVRIRAADGEAPVWHPDVRFFRVDDEAGEPLAAFFLDPHSRPAEKRGGAWMDECVGKSRLFRGADGRARLPVAYLVCNQMPPVGRKPSLMSFDEVETLFHEFGHGLQHMLTRVEYGLASGIRNVEWDAVELPSQFMENWCYHRETLLGFARHYGTAEPLPDALFEKLKRARTYRAGRLKRPLLHC